MRDGNWWGAGRMSYVWTAGGEGSGRLDAESAAGAALNLARKKFGSRGKVVSFRMTGREYVPSPYGGAPAWRKVWEVTLAQDAGAPVKARIVENGAPSDKKGWPVLLQLADPHRNPAADETVDVFAVAAGIREKWADAPKVKARNVYKMF